MSYNKTRWNSTVGYARRASKTSYRRAPLASRRYKPWYGRTQYSRSANAMAVQALRGVRSLSSRVQGERRYVDQITAINSSTTPNGVVLNDLPDGSGPTERAGFAMRMLYLDMKGIILASTTNPASFTRVVVVMDTQQLPDTTPAYTDIFSDASMTSNLRSTTLGRYTILYDQLHGSAAAANNPACWDERIWINQTARYNGNAAGDIQKNGLFLYILGSDASSGPYVEVRCRLCYIDN